MSEWIEWRGGYCPVTFGTLVDVLYRGGEQAFGIPALTPLDRGCPSAEHWSHKGHPRDIIAYRVHVSKAAPGVGGWIEWHGGDNPCPPGVIVEWRTRGMKDSASFFFGPCEAGLLNWEHLQYDDDIIAFRIVGDVVMRGPAEPVLILPQAARTTTVIYAKFRGYRQPYPRRVRA